MTVNWSSLAEQQARVRVLLDCGRELLGNLLSYDPSATSFRCKIDAASTAIDGKTTVTYFDPSKVASISFIEAE